jgi:hypothetical protein
MWLRSFRRKAENNSGKALLLFSALRLCYALYLYLTSGYAYSSSSGKKRTKKTPLG